MKSRPRKFVGYIGLLWFLFCAFAAIDSLVRPEDLRAYSSYSWTDREIRIGAMCYLIAGTAGLVPFVRRVVLPRFPRGARIGAHAAPCLLSIGVVPTFEDFAAFFVPPFRRRLRWVMTAGVIYLMVLKGVMDWRVEHGLPRVAGQRIWVFAATTGVVILTCAFYFVFARLMARCYWRFGGQLREARRYDFFEDGLLVQGWTFSRQVPWGRVKRARLMGGAIVLFVGSDWYILPRSLLEAQGLFDPLVKLLRQSMGYAAKV